MGQFEHFRTLDVKGDATRELTLHQIELNGVAPTLIVAPATDANKPYFNAAIKATKPQIYQAQKGNFSAALISETRDEDRELFPRFVIRGWRDVTNQDGEPVTFNDENCLDFVTSLPDWVFDEITMFCKNPQNFTKTLDAMQTGNG